MQKVWWALLLVLSAALAGCSDDGASDDDSTDAPDDRTDTGTQTGTDTGTSTGADDAPDDDGDGGDEGDDTPPAVRSVNLTADTLNGTAPVTITFTLTAEGAEAATYRFAHGDGTDESGNGTDLPLDIAYTYEVGGTFTPTLEVDFGDEVLSTNLTVVIEAPAAAAPDVVHWVLGPANGCHWDAPTVVGGPALDCASYAAGPDAPAVDGHWIALDERYWGMTITSTVDKGPGHGTSEDDWPLYDTDCWFVADDAATALADGHNGGGPCAGPVPEGTAWLFVAPWGTPAIEFILDAA